MREIKERLVRDIKNMWVTMFALIVYTVLVNLVFGAFCPMVIITGFPCPGCGMTRAVFYLFTGRLQQSVAMNPLAIPIVCLAVYFLWNRYIIGKKAKGMMLLIGAAAVLLILFYVWRMYLFFPDSPPYVYNEKNITAQIFPFYEQILHDCGIL
ncbi:MAG: DUF2752 domain-containing protein [Roseburia sp.]|nr:DUF2752 domain-containing protein [Ruminococcus sp.]MCM1153885.1 DUF2752 domain-containing protein [Roseburia sp.]MCM1241365.1 DUF2752 domain-containing protein [Roseburia sp.]